MCARFVILDDNEIAEINQILKDVNMKFDGTGIVAKTGEVFSTDNVPAVMLQNEKPSLTIIKWDGEGVIINAKSETATDKKMFSAAVSTRRCIIPSNGFYEWSQAMDKSKTKYRFNSLDSPMLYLAGLHTNFSNQESDSLLTERFVILTTTANSDVNDVHTRMPVILHKDEIVRWLRDYDYAKSIISRNTLKLIREAV